MKNVIKREEITLYAARLLASTAPESQAERVKIIEHFDALVCDALDIEQEENPPHFLFSFQ